MLFFYDGLDTLPQLCNVTSRLDSQLKGLITMLSKIPQSDQSIIHEMIELLERQAHSIMNQYIELQNKAVVEKRFRSLRVSENKQAISQ